MSNKKENNASHEAKITFEGPVGESVIMIVEGKADENGKVNAEIINEEKIVSTHANKDTFHLALAQFVKEMFKHIQIHAKE